MFLGLVILLGTACTRDTPPPGPGDLTINLRWNKAYPTEGKSEIESGLTRALSFLGAEFPRSSPSAFIWRDRALILDLDRAVVAAGTRDAWQSLVAVMKQSDEYRSTGGMDIGRFVMLTLCSPNHYYALTGAARNLSQVRQSHAFDKLQMPIVESEIASGNRLIEIGSETTVDRMAFMAYEGTGSLREGTFERKDIEFLDLMKNGQLRFALYDLNGRLKTSTSPSLTAAGKPGKCVWCHQIRLQIARRNVTDLDGYYTTKSFNALIDERMEILERYRRGLASKVDFSLIQEHEYAELLYQSFVEPSLERLAMEWNIPVEQAAQRLKGKPTHAPPSELWILGRAVYRREDIDELAPYNVIKVAADPRESTDYEPDLLR